MTPVTTRTGIFGMPRPAVVGHRGARRSEPENTPAAFRAAAEEGASWVELDVRLSADGIPVVVHDPVVGDDDAVSDLDAAELAARGVDTLEAVLAGLPTGLGVDVEVKHRRGEPGWDPEVVVAHRTAPVAAAHHRHRPLVLTSFDPMVLACVGELAPEVPRGLLTPVLTSLATCCARARELGCGVLAPHYSAPGLTADGVAGIHAVGFDVLVWTVNSSWRVRRLAAAGVDAICTDDVGGTVATLAEARHA